MTHSPATDWSVAFLGHLMSQGITDVVVSPGARSQALALAALQWERVEGSTLTLHVVIDERSAAFRALGLALGSGRPAVCLSTSGSAPSHYYPAVLEALHAGVPLIVVSADRPSELHGVGANQTTQQAGLFGPRVPSWSVAAPDDQSVANAHDTAQAAADAAWLGGPAHVNIEFREPLSARVESADLVLPGSTRTEKTAQVASLEMVPGPGTLVIAGHGAGPRASALAVELGAPLIAEIVSQARFGPHLVPAYREVLAQADLVASVRRVITVGRPTLSRGVSALLANPDLEHIVLQGGEYEAANPTRGAKIVTSITVGQPATKTDAAQWTKPWVMAGRLHHQALLSTLEPAAPDIAAAVSDDQATRSAFAAQEMAVMRRSVSRGSLALALWEATWPHDRLVLGASRMVREADAVVPGKNITVFSNRGLSGIDGTIATARGIAWSAAREGAIGTTRVLLGDLAFVHDVGSLLREVGREDSSRVHLFIANDGGGSIFDQLEVSQSASEEDRDRVLFTPHGVNIEAVATAYGWSYVAPGTMGELSDALSSAQSHLIVDIALPRA